MGTCTYLTFTHALHTYSSQLSQSPWLPLCLRVHCMLRSSLAPAFARQIVSNPLYSAVGTQSSLRVQEPVRGTIFSHHPNCLPRPAQLLPGSETTTQYLPGAPTLHIRGMCMSRTSMGKRQSILDAGCQLQNLIQRPHPTLPQTCLSSAPVTHRICRQPVALLFSAPSVHTWVCSYLCRKNSTLLP